MAVIKTGWYSQISKDQQTYDAARREWLLAFRENGINTLELLERGLAMARRDESAFLDGPGQFIKWCRNSSTDSALYQRFIEVVRQPIDRRNWRQYSPVLHWIYGQIGSHEVNSMPVKDLERAFHRCLDRAKQMRDSGYKFEHKELVALPEKVDPVYEDEEKVQDILKQIREGK